MTDDKKITITHSGSNTIITGSGSLDLYVSKELHSRLKEAVERAEPVVVDLRSAVFIDTAILSYLIWAAKEMMGQDRRLRVLVSTGGHPEQVIHTTGLKELMDVEAEPPSS